MKKNMFFRSAGITLFILLVIAMGFGLVRPAWVGVALAQQGNPPDEGQAGASQTPAGSDEIPPAAVAPGSVEAPNAEATTLVYFAPQDNDGNATVILLYNTTAVTHTVTVKAYNSSGGLLVNMNVDVAAYALVHLVSDALVASPPPSWVGSTVANFTDFTTYASLAVPQGIKVDGYVVFNQATGTVDPRIDQGAIPLRFSTDPMTVFLPAVNKTP